jgi:hypothetical protein
MLEKPTFIQGLYGFEGRGLATPIAFEPPVTYTVPFDKRAQMIYFRAGNPAAEMIYVVLTRTSKPMRYFPVGAKGAIHIPLAVVEDIDAHSKVEVLIAAPEGMKSSILLDIGFMEIG